MSTKTHPETSLQKPAQEVLMTPEARGQRPSIAAAFEIILIVAIAILTAFTFVHSRHSGGSER